MAGHTNSNGKRGIDLLSRGVSVNPVRIVLADDHTLVLEAFRELLAGKFEVVGTASNGRELIQVARQLQPDIVVTDVSMPELNGLDASIKLLKLMPQLKFIFLTVSNDPDFVAKVMRAGAKGYLLKSSAASELVKAIEVVSGGATYVTPLVAGGMLQSLMRGDDKKKDDQLTVRQREILQLLAEGNSMKETAKILHLTPRTVAFHKYRIMDNLGIDNNADLVRYAFRNGIIEA